MSKTFLRKAQQAGFLHNNFCNLFSSNSVFSCMFFIQAILPCPCPCPCPCLRAAPCLAPAKTTQQLPLRLPVDILSGIEFQPNGTQSGFAPEGVRVTPRLTCAAKQVRLKRIVGRRDGYAVSNKRFCKYSSGTRPRTLRISMPTTFSFSS